MRQRVFIGSSGDNLAILKKVESHLSDTFDCITWTKAFSQNKSNLDSLIKQTRISDFSILIAMPDDILVERNETYRIARDNVIFEFGLFLGSAGLQHSFLLAEESIDLPSDLEGITIAKFSMNDSRLNSIESVCEQLKNDIENVSKTSHLGLLPSIALAIGYYYSFVKKVCEELHQNSKVIIGELPDQKEVAVRDFKFRIIIPEDLDDNGVNDFKAIYNKRQALKSAVTGSVSSAKRGYPLVFKLEPPDQDTSKVLDIQLFDVPTTLNTIVETIRLYIPSEHVGKNEDIERLEKRELANFAKTLRYLISKNVSTADNVTVEEGVKAR